MFHHRALAGTTLAASSTHVAGGVAAWAGCPAVPRGLPVPAVIWWHGGSYMYEKPSVLLTHTSRPWGCPTSACAMGMSRVLLLHGDAPHPVVPWGCLVSVCAVGLSLVSPCHGDAPHPSTPWDCSMSVCTMGLPHVHPRHIDASPDLLAATEHKGRSPSSACCQRLSTCAGCEFCSLCWDCRGAFWLGAPQCVPWGAHVWFRRIFL